MIKQATEIETKLLLDRSGAQRLLDATRVLDCADQLNIYYDWKWRLADTGATLRVRLQRGSDPTLTLKLPRQSRRGAPRRMREYELAQAQLALWPTRTRVIDLTSDVPSYLSRLLARLGLKKLERVGAVRNRRYTLSFDGARAFELDEVRLPGQGFRYEAEIESADPAAHRDLTALIRRVAPGARPAVESKFSAFRHAGSPDLVGVRRQPTGAPRTNRIRIRKDTDGR